VVDQQWARTLERELAFTSGSTALSANGTSRMSGYELQGISFPCYEIGGDYYDFIERDDGRLVIAVTCQARNCCNASDVVTTCCRAAVRITFTGLRRSR
jgi:serine phosphatase RsbU (regulator of sigma subunit)